MGRVDHSFSAAVLIAAHHTPHALKILINAVLANFLRNLFGIGRPILTLDWNGWE